MRIIRHYLPNRTAYLATLERHVARWPTDPRLHARALRWFDMWADTGVSDAPHPDTAIRKTDIH